ncbi:MAG TPA: DUF2723 domain-containing protein [Kofleriaceae bacterium]|nr:DUF2723 domain-containing protein [Kofleriaceae bacterium]
MLRSLAGRVARIAFEKGGLLVLAVLAAYVWLAPAHVVDGDNAELSTLGALGGAAHPPGYPLYVLWLRATAWLPGATPAHTAAIATAILGALSIAMLHAACRAWGARPPGAALACALFAGAPVVAQMYSEAEVFALNGLVVAAVAWLAAAAGPARGWARAAALGLVAGLGLANQLTCVLVAPIGVLGVARAVRERGWFVLLAACLGLAIGLLPYAYLLVAPVHAATWGDLHGVADLVPMWLRADYGGPTTLATQRGDVSAWASLAALAETLGRTWLWLPALAGVTAAIGYAARTRDRREPRASWIAWLASFVLAGPVLVARFNIPPTGTGRWVVDRFHLLPALLLAIPIACVLDRVVARLRAPLAAGLAVAVFAAMLAASLPRLARVHAPAVEDQARTMLASLPACAVIIGASDDVGSGIDYAQLVLGVRPDVQYVREPMLGLAWYRARVASRGIALDGIVDHALDQGRAVFVERRHPDLLAKFAHYPFGIFTRLIAPGAPRPSVREVIDHNRALFAQLASYPRPHADDEWPALVHVRYARAWRELAELATASGDGEAAAWAEEAGRVLGPEP